MITGLDGRSLSGISGVGKLHCPPFTSSSRTRASLYEEEFSSVPEFAVRNYGNFFSSHSKSPRHRRTVRVRELKVSHRGPSVMAPTFYEH